MLKISIPACIIFCGRCDENLQLVCGANKPILEKESYKYLDAMDKNMENIGNEIRVVQVCDRESDIYEFFKKAQDEKKIFLIRAVQNRKIPLRVEKWMGN